MVRCGTFDVSGDETLLYLRSGDGDEINGGHAGGGVGGGEGGGGGH